MYNFRVHRTTESDPDLVLALLSNPASGSKVIISALKFDLSKFCNAMADVGQSASKSYFSTVFELLKIGRKSLFVKVKVNRVKMTGALFLIAKSG